MVKKTCCPKSLLYESAEIHTVKLGSQQIINV
jgi:hypothetical protein